MSDEHRTMGRDAQTGIWPNGIIGAMAASTQIAEQADAAARLIALEARLRELGGMMVAYSGGVFGSRILLGSFRAWMAPEVGVRVTAPVYGPSIGALLEAYRAAGRPGILLNRDRKGKVFS